VRLVALTQTDSTGEEKPCRPNRTLRAQRDSGVLFVGATDDEEPVWVRLQGNSVLEHGQLVPRSRSCSICADRTGGAEREGVSV